MASSRLAASEPTQWLPALTLTLNPNPNPNQLTSRRNGSPPCPRPPRRRSRLPSGREPPLPARRAVRAASSTIGRCPLLELGGGRLKGGRACRTSWPAQLEISWHVGVSVACTSRPLDYFGLEIRRRPLVRFYPLGACRAATQASRMTAVTLSASPVGTHDPLVALCGGRRPRCTHMVSERDGDAGCAHTAT